MSARTISIEGSDGAGKETQTNLLVSHFERQGKKVGRVSFPRYNQTLGGTLLYEVMKGERSDNYAFSKVAPKIASKLYAMDREESLPFLNNLISNNDVVVFDRYVESNLLHQGGKFDSTEERTAFAEWLVKLEYDDIKLPKPDEVVYLSLPFWLSRKRAELRSVSGGSKLDAVEKDLDYVKRGHDSGIFYAEHFNWHVVEGLKDKRELTPEEIHQQVLHVLGC
jgi:dTMP kinase